MKRKKDDLDFVVDDDDIEYEDGVNEEDEDEEDDEDDDEEDDKIDSKFMKMIKNIMDNKGINKVKDKDNKGMNNRYTTEEKEYYNKLTKEEKEKIDKLELELIKEDLKEPLRFKLLKINTTLLNKQCIMNKYEELINLESSSGGDYYKLHNWINTISKLPLGIYKKLPINNTNNFNEISSYLRKAKNILDDNIYGHKEAKEQIIRIITQLISYPEAKAFVIGIQGSMGIGKTKLIKDGISKALEIPFSFIGLGGVSEANYLKGHSYTYEGSRYGKIVESLIKARALNSILYFDELDKVADSNAGNEIINTLIHITDGTQNDKFTDRYLEEIDIDLSKSLIFFSYNDERMINPILKDRMITINVKGYNMNDKLIIARDYLLRDILKEYNINKEDIIINDEMIKYIIENTETEEGVRNLQRNLNNIISYINLYKYLPKDDIKIEYPFKINKNFIDKHIKKKETEFKLSLYL